MISVRIFIQYRKWPFPARFLIVWIFFSFIPISAKSAACRWWLVAEWSIGLFHRSSENTMGSYSVKNETIFMIFWFNRLIELVAINRFIVNRTSDFGTVTLNSSNFSDFLKIWFTTNIFGADITWFCLSDFYSGHIVPRPFLFLSHDPKLWEHRHLLDDWLLIHWYSLSMMMSVILIFWQNFPFSSNFYVLAFFFFSKNKSESDFKSLYFK